MGEKENGFGPSVTTYPFQLEGITNGGMPAGGGLQSVITNELGERSRTTPPYELVILSNDDVYIAIPQARAEIVGANPAVALDPNIFSIWFGERWSMVHPDAFSSKGYTDQVLSAMYQGEYTTPPGSIDRIAEHQNKYGPSVMNPEAEKAFVHRFEGAVKGIQPHSVVNWQDYFFVPLIQKYGEELREKGCYQTFHHHMSFPKELEQFAWGRELLQAMSAVDIVFVHTDVEVRRVQTQLENQGLRVPEVKRFDLGIDRHAIEDGLDRVNRDNYQDRPEYRSLSDEQKRVLDEIYRTEGSIPHRFLDFGRLDPQKGTSVLLEGIDTYLESLSLGLEELRSNYRFFFLMEFKEPEFFDQYNLKNQYNRHVNGMLDRIQKKYPGVIHASSSVPRIFVPSLAKGAHIMTGGIQDGLNLAVQEALYANALANQDVNGIVGMGTGFAMQTRQSERHKDLVYFVRVGNTQDVADSIRISVRIKTEQPGELGRRTKAVAHEVILKRNDTIFVRP